MDADVSRGGGFSATGYAARSLAMRVTSSGSTVADVPAGWLRRGTVVLLIALSVWACTYRLGAVPLLDDPNEGEYAEVAREMVETGEWISPQLNYVLFLNKPPLTYWMIALSYLCFGVNEFAARLPSAVAGWLIIIFVWRLGTLLYDAGTGLLAAFILLATGGFFVETHEVRPDLLLTAAIVGSLVAIVRFVGRGRVGASVFSPLPWGASAWFEGLDPAPCWPLLALQVALAAGVLAKGLVALIVPAGVLAVRVVSQRRRGVIPRLLHPRTWWLFALLVVPWHLVMSLQHTGFLWDYVLNQHILFFFNQKSPRDSLPVSLPVFWEAFALRLFPWTVFVPLAFVAAVQRARRDSAQYGDRLVLAWTLTVLLFFSASGSRMEHYSIPALPAVALLVSRLLRDYARDGAPAWQTAVTVHVAIFALAALAGPFVVPRVVAAQDWLASIRELPDIARTVFTLLAAGTAVAAAGALARRRFLLAPTIAATFVVAIPLFHEGLALMAPINSSRPLAQVVAAFADASERVVYEAPIEYQSCAGFNFYLRRRLDLLRPPGFVAPRYLAPHADGLFITREDLHELWHAERVFFITDPLLARPALDDVVPKPVYIVARDRVRWVASSRPVH